MSSKLFYAQLPMLTKFEDAGRQASYSPLPDDWHVAMCDVRNSTEAVAAGRYKSVNTLGAAVITAILSVAGDIDIPFIFEGDGAVLCVPPELLSAARGSLLHTQMLARDSFGLDLRIATMPVARVREAGFSIMVARYKVSEHYIQAMFSGGGIPYAEHYMKDAATAPLCAIAPGSVETSGSFDGLECRWKDIPSRYGETISLMVRVMSADPEKAARTYRELIAKVREVFGTDEACHPVWPPNLAFTFSGNSLADEVAVRAMGRSAMGRWVYLMKTRWMILLGWFLMTFGIRTAETDWGRYKTILARNSDVKKFNDCFRQILSGNFVQRERIAVWLEDRYAQGELVFGMHVTDRAQMTCLVFNYSGRHLHFIDGADGGLFLAAKELKRRLNELNGV